MSQYTVEIENTGILCDSLDEAKELLETLTQNKLNVANKDWESIRNIEECELPFKIGDYTLCSTEGRGKLVYINQENS